MHTVHNIEHRLSEQRAHMHEKFIWYIWCTTKTAHKNQCDVCFVVSNYIESNSKYRFCAVVVSLSPIKIQSYARREFADDIYCLFCHYSNGA